MTFLRTATLLPAALALATVSAIAQPVFDGTTGGQVAGTTAAATIDVDQGTRAGGNVFHSFTSFSIPIGQTVTFTDVTPTTSVNNIINRVTGTSLSALDGTLRSVVAGANVWLINPNGVIVGRTAIVDVPAGFHLSTADELHFSDGGVLQMTAGSSTFSSALPAAFGFTGPANGDIVIAGNGAATFNPVTGRLLANLRFGAQSNVSLTAGDITIIDSDIELRGPRFDAAAVGDGANQVSTANFAAVSPLTGTLTLDWTEIIHIMDDAAAPYAAVVRLQAGQILFGTRAQATAVPIPGSAPRGPFLQNAVTALDTIARGTYAGADIELFADNIVVDSFGLDAGFSASGPGRYSGIHTYTHLAVCAPCTLADRLANSGASGSIRITANNTLHVSDAARISTFSFTAGASGDIEVEAAAIRLLNFGGLNTFAGAFGDSGRISLTADEITLSDNAFIDTRSDPASALPAAQLGQNIASAGNAGDIAIDAGTVRVERGASIQSYASESDSGAISIAAGSLVLTSLGTAHFYQTTRIGGFEVVTADLGTYSTIPTIRSLVSSRGSSGAIMIDAGLLNIADGGILSAESGLPDGRLPGFATFFGTAFVPAAGSGNILINADTVRIEGTARGTSTVTLPNFVPDGRVPAAIVTNAGANSGGSAGDVEINANLIELLSGGVIAATTVSAQNGGTVTLRTDHLRVVGRPDPVLAALPFYDFGAGYFNVFDSSALIADTFGSGRAGRFLIFADLIDITDGGALLARTSGSGLGGIIVVCNASDVNIDGAGSALATSSRAGSTGDAGFIIVQSDRVALSNGGQVSVETLGTGLGGQILVQAHEFTATGGAGISTLTGSSAATGAGAGRIAIEAGLVSLSAGAVLATDTLGASPAGRIQIRASQLFVDGSTTKISSTAVGNAGGDAGSIEIGTVDFSLSGGAVWSTLADSGAGGDIVIDWNGTGRITGAGVHTDVLGGASGGGSILFGSVRLADLNLSAVCELFCAPFDPFANVPRYDPTSTTTRVLILEGATIDASAQQGPGGTIVVAPDVVLLSNGDLPPDFDVSSVTGPDGSVIAPAPFTPPPVIIVPERNVTNRCQSGARPSALADNLTGRGAVGADPTTLLPSGLPNTASPTTTATSGAPCTY